MAHKPLPERPAPIVELPRYISQHPEKPMAKTLEPYRQYEAGLRSLFTQDRQNPVFQDPHVNVLPLFTNDTKLITTRARDLSTESAEEKTRYIVPLTQDKCRANGSPATVSGLSEFQKNFNIFSESSLAEIVLRVYSSVSEVLTGFDVDAAGGAYDGKQVYITPRTLGSFVTQINHIDLEVSNYHTFSVSYGQRFDAKRIEKLCYTRDLLLNAEWNQNDKREVNLHRHPAFFGRVEDIIEDCCGYCPEPATDEESEAAERESQIYISGKISFLTDDDGRQQIGSCNPLTENDWTDMTPKTNEFRLFLELLDPHLLGHLFLQRKNLPEDGSNPVHSWISKVSGSKYEQESSDSYFFYGRPEEDYDTEESSVPYKDDKTGLVEMLQLLLQSCEGEGMEMFNGAGDTCLHTSVMNRQLGITKTLIEFKLSLIYRENAVGRTPLEVAQDIVTASKLARPRQIELSRLEPGDRKAPFEFGDGNATPVPSLVELANLELRLFGSGGTPVKPPKELTKQLSKAVILDLCATGANNNPMKRRLVSLNEANDAAGRLGEMKDHAAKEKENKKSNDIGDEDDNKAPSSEEAMLFQLQNAKRWSKALED
ncbi:unnamed protein product [Clonostachys rosea f. rosea IK726]|uniref:Uncharacterized protein n=1 Tax=Clonostachys rosea f. rosea IK726 TaxID=1349383 RepID=A0ACA9UCK3_BIOOC|nr:unnamed protein product [Clonostachys rosea f. rosea IK726]